MNDALPDIPGLTIVQTLGSGGFGVVYRARQPQLDRDVAVKLDNRVLPGEERAKFLREARAAARLSGHPNVVNIFDAGITADGRPYIVMELCPGGSLLDLLQREGPLAPERVLDIGIRLADALGFAHEAGVLHRDIKPANVLIDAFGAVKLADFGLAAILDAPSESTITMGALSPSYAAPEVFAWGAPSPAADVYSLAATLYTLAAGHLPREIPWPPESLDQLAGAFRAQVKPIPGAAPQVNVALARALAADISQRTPSPRLLADELAGSRPAPVAPPPPPAGKKSNQLKVLVLAAVAAVVVAAVAVYITISPSGNGGKPTDTRAAPVAPPIVSPPPKLEDCVTTPGYCVTEACFGGLVQINDVRTASARPCAGEHSWEAFSGGWLPDGSMEVAIEEIEKLPAVTAVCTPELMKTRTKPGGDTAAWEISVLMMDKGSNGKPYFYCVAMPEAGGTVTSRMFVNG
ncbi:serine/threonine protein kinase [Kibdelosporangium banguiense]|uniref:non-specific serine/threonine protein kinase n=1 Tax=Kibdelosporangium banguiense TaxID=1365924 RepID=A0ABS4TEA4_9PSEU|nr:serine/threonine-protein kinase [Kibdelosporangium banguiense]MBP2322686.1 serine/threonine protein kinase [Kibdelosporangium banguiense]